MRKRQRKKLILITNEKGGKKEWENEQSYLMHTYLEVSPIENGGI